MKNNLAAMDVGPESGSVIYMLGDIEPHIHPFWVLGFPLLNEGPLAVLRTNDSLISPVPSIELVPGELKPIAVCGFLLPRPGIYAGKINSKINLRE